MDPILFKHRDQGNTYIRKGTLKQSKHLLALLFEQKRKRVQITYWSYGLNVTGRCSFSSFEAIFMKFRIKPAPS